MVHRTYVIFECTLNYDVNSNINARTQAHVSSILERFESEEILKLLGAMLSERRVLIIGKHFVSVARCVIASISMLYPFRWQHVLLPVVPDHLIALTLSPMPYILGMRSSQFESLGVEYGESLGT